MAQEEYMMEDGRNEYDFHARNYIGQGIPRFDRMDPKAEDYAPVSPYLPFAANPINVTDPTGEDIVVLNCSKGLHMAMLIQNKEKKWEYYSVNGNNVYISGKFSGGRPFNDVGVGNWDSPEEFLNSAYNSKEEDGEENRDINNFGFDEGYRISTTPEQDAVMRKKFKEISKTRYDLMVNNCAIAVQKTMIKAGLPVTKQPFKIKFRFDISILMRVEGKNGIEWKKINIVPGMAYKDIILANPNGVYIKKLK